MRMQASLLASAALTAEVAVLKQDLKGSKAELFPGPLEVLLHYGNLRSQCGGCQQRSLHMHIDILILDSCDIV